MRREAILRGAETYYDTQDDRAASFISDYSKAMTRNKQLLEVCDMLKTIYLCKNI